MKYYFKKGYSGTKIIEDFTIKIERDKIVDITFNECHDCIDFTDAILTPSFVDIHTHGIKGIDSFTASEEDFKKWERVLLMHGVQFFVPTIVSAPIPVIENFLTNVKSSIPRGNILAGRLEGPLISINKKGAHNPKNLIPPSKFPIKHLISKYRDALKIIDIAPELDGAIEMIKNFNESIIFSIGHTDCTTEKCVEGFNAGSRHVTHLFNAMRPFHHRDPGLIGESLVRDDVNVEFIADLIHLAPETIKLIFKCKKLENIVMITDSISATLMGDGQYKLGELDVEVKEGVAKIKGTDTIAGSTLTLDKAFKNMISIGFKPEQFLSALTVNPSRIMGINHGYIDIGNYGRMNVFDTQFNLKGIIRGGKYQEVGDIDGY